MLWFSSLTTVAYLHGGGDATDPGGRPRETGAVQQAGTLRRYRPVGIL